MKALAFAWRSLVRQPARAALGILGVAAVGALLFDMLLLSDGLVTSMREMLERTGFDIRVTATGELPRGGRRIANASAVTAAFAELPEVERALAIRFADGVIVRPPTGAASEDDAGSNRVGLEAVSGDGPQPWTVLRGRDATALNEVVINQALATDLGVQIGDRLPVRARCRSRSEILPPALMQVVGVAEFPLTLDQHVLGSSMATLDAACGGNSEDQADAVLVRAAGDVDAAAAALLRVRPDVRPMTNEQVVGRVRRTGFTYFQQISAVLTTVTLGFALLLITVLLTVSVNQRLGEIAALRALGFSRRRVVADVLCESVLIVGLGGALSLPLGVALAKALDRILTDMPGIPSGMHFFVFEPRALAWHGGLLAVTAISAALEPMRLVARLPIASTLRNEVVS
jgi:putative ABC transport system permease protein